MRLSNRQSTTNVFSGEETDATDINPAEKDKNEMDVVISHFYIRMMIYNLWILLKFTLNTS